MSLLEERLVGKRLASIDAHEPAKGIGVTFTDGSGFNVWSRLSSSLFAREAASVVERVSTSETEVIMHFNGGGYVSISIDRENQDAVEFFVFHDTDGQIVVEN